MKSKTILLTVFFNFLLGVGAQKGQSLAQGLNELHDNDKNTLEFIPVKLASEGSSGSYKFKNKQYLPLERKSVLIKDFQFEKFADKKLGIRINLPDGEANTLAKISKKYKNQKMAVLLNGKVVSVPHLKNAVGKDELELPMGDLGSFENVFDGLVS